MRPSIGFDRDIKMEWLDAVATQVGPTATIPARIDEFRAALGG